MKLGVVDSWYERLSHKKERACVLFLSTSSFSDYYPLEENTRNTSSFLTIYISILSICQSERIPHAIVTVLESYLASVLRVNGFRTVHILDYLGKSDYSWTFSVQNYYKNDHSRCTEARQIQIDLLFWAMIEKYFTKLKGWTYLYSRTVLF